MNSNPIILVIDQGTTSTRAVLLDSESTIVGMASEVVKQIYPKTDWVEHNADQIWESVTICIIQLKEKYPALFKCITSIGITNQRETTVVWNRSNGKPFHNAIVWQDTRTADFCKNKQIFDAKIRSKTGLILNPYFSATKIKWILDKYDPKRNLCINNNINAGTIDTFLIWKFSGTKSFYTDHTNASRTLLMNIFQGNWDNELLSDFNIPLNILPEIKPSVSNFGVTSGLYFLPDGIPITGVAGDQQASLVGHRCHSLGQAKCTFGTGAFLLSHTGNKPITSESGLLTTLAATTGNELQYCLEGSVFIAGAVVQWLRDSVNFFDNSKNSESFASSADINSEVIFIPSLTGLGCPYWNSDFKGTILGLSRKTTRKEITKASLEGVAQQVSDLVEAIEKNSSRPLLTLAIDGGMTSNNFFNQILADTIGTNIQKSSDEEMTAIGAGILAGIGSGIMKLADFNNPNLQSNKSYSPVLTRETRNKNRERWKKAINSLAQFYSTL